MLTISTHYRHKISSQMLNDRIRYLIGGNAILLDLNISKKNNSTLCIQSGRFSINGAIIEILESIDIDVNKAGFIKIIYNHVKKNIDFIIVDDAVCDINSLAIGKVSFANSEITNLVVFSKINLLSELTDKLEVAQIEVGKSLSEKNPLNSLVTSNNERIDILESLIDDLIIPSIIDLDYRKEKLMLELGTVRNK